MNDIEILETMLKIRKEQKEIIEYANGYCRNCNEDITALEHAIIALKERQEDKEKIKELEAENKIFALEGSRVRLKMYIDKNYIPKSLVKEKIK